MRPERLRSGALIGRANGELGTLEEAKRRFEGLGKRQYLLVGLLLMS